MRISVQRAAKLQGELVAPGDKSISHRALLFAALGAGSCELRHLSPGADVASTAACLRALGVSIAPDGEGVRVRGVGLRGLRAPANVLDCGNSGTSMRLLAGILAGSGVGGTLDGDESLRSRPMRRVLDPLRAMGAVAQGDDRAPLHISAGATLNGIRHELPIASAQVKSCVLLAGLWARGDTVVREPSPSRDHTERMLRALGVALQTEPDGALRLTPPTQDWQLPEAIEVPGDPSSAAFALAAGVLVPGAEMRVRGVDVNPTRAGFIRALLRMGADLEQRETGTCAGEPVAELRVCGGRALRGISIAADEIPSLIDEVSLLAIVATQATGTTELRGASELRVKESDRLAQVARGLLAMGARVEELPDGLRIHGPTPLHAADVDAARDHRIAMGFAIAGLVADGTTRVDGAEWANISFPGFFEMLRDWTGGALAL